jgi:hypothetical protein
MGHPPVSQHSKDCPTIARVSIHTYMSAHLVTNVLDADIDV